MEGKEEIFEHFNIQALFELSEEKFGKKITHLNAGLLYIWYLVERNQVRPNKQAIIDYLLDNKVFDNTRDVAENTNRYLLLRSKMPRLSPIQNARLDRSKRYLDPEIPFEQVGSRMLGIIESNLKGNYSVVDISNGKENIVAEILKGGGISWRDNIEPEHMKWVIESARWINPKYVKENKII